MFGNGIDNIMAVDHLLRGKRLGLVTNHTGVSLELRSTSQILQEKYDLRFLVGPEHGVAGVAQAGQKVQDNTDPKTGLPVISFFNGYDKALDNLLRENSGLRYCMVHAGSKGLVEASLVTAMRTSGAAAKFTYDGDIAFATDGTSMTVNQH